MGSDRRRGVHAAAIALFVVATAGPAWGQAQPTAADRETARALMAEGREKREAGDLASALKAFTAADTIMRVTTTGIEVARTQERMGRLIEARETVQNVLRIPLQPSDPAPFLDARRAAEALDADLAKRIPSLVVEVTSELEGPITLTIDEQTIAPELIGIARKLDPGRHVVVARAGDGEARAEVNVLASETKRVALHIAKAGPSVTSEPDAADADHGVEGSSRRIPVLSLVGFGVGAVGLVAGSAAGIISISKKDSATADCVGKECPRSAEADLDSANTFATISNIGFGVALAGAAVGLVGLFVLRPAELSPPAAARVTPYIGAGRAGIVGQF